MAGSTKLAKEISVFSSVRAWDAGRSTTQGRALGCRFQYFLEAMTMRNTKHVCKDAGSQPDKKRFAFWKWALLSMWGVLASQYLRAQSTGLTGAVTDPSGAAVRNAQVTFLNEATGVTSKFATSTDGVYSAPVDAGSYDVTVESSGFRTFVATQVLVQIGAMPTYNIKLTVGANNVSRRAPARSRVSPP